MREEAGLEIEEGEIEIIDQEADHLVVTKADLHLKTKSTLPDSEEEQRNTISERHLKFMDTSTKLISRKVEDLASFISKIEEMLRMLLKE